MFWACCIAPHLHCGSPQCVSGETWPVSRALSCRWFCWKGGRRKARPSRQFSHCLCTDRWATKGNVLGALLLLLVVVVGRHAQCCHLSSVYPYNPLSLTWAAHHCQSWHFVLFLWQFKTKLIRKMINKQSNMSGLTFGEFQCHLFLFWSQWPSHLSK